MEFLESVQDFPLTEGCGRAVIRDFALNKNLKSFNAKKKLGVLSDALVVFGDVGAKHMTSRHLLLAKLNASVWYQKNTWKKM